MNAHSAEVSQLAVVSLPPGEDLPVHGQGHGVAAARVHGHLLHHVVAEGGDLAGDGDGAAGQAQAQPAVGGLSAGVDLPLHRHCTQNAQVGRICTVLLPGNLSATQQTIRSRTPDTPDVTATIDIYDYLRRRYQCTTVQ